MYRKDQRTVVTPDAGGTNLVFGAMRGCEFIGETVTYPSNAHDLELCLATMVKGFSEIINRLEEKPVAISFAFPGPARLSQWHNRRISAQLPVIPRRSGTRAIP